MSDETKTDACERTWDRIKDWGVPQRAHLSTWYDRLALATASLDLPPLPKLDGDSLDGVRHTLLKRAAEMMTLAEDGDAAGLVHMAKGARDLATTYAWMSVVAVSLQQEWLPAVLEELRAKAKADEEPGE